MLSLILSSRLAILIVLCSIVCFNTTAQHDHSTLEAKTILLIAGVQFQNFSLPLRDINSNFTHPGLFVGTEFFYDQDRQLVQQFTLGGYLNQEMGNGFHVTTQFGYRPNLFKDLFGEIKVGINYLRVFHPTQAYDYVHGEWEKTAGGKSQIGIPFDLGLSYRIDSSTSELSPFVLYQITPALFYNETLPLNIYTNIIIGLRMQLKSS